MRKVSITIRCKDLALGIYHGIRLSIKFKSFAWFKVALMTWDSRTG